MTQRVMSGDIIVTIKDEASNRSQQNRSTSESDLSTITFFLLSKALSSLTIVMDIFKGIVVLYKGGP